MQLTEQHVIGRDDPRYQAIDAAAFASKNLYNAALYVMVKQPVTKKEQNTAVTHIVPKSLAEYSSRLTELPVGSMASSSSVSDHTLECCSSSRPCGSALRVSESRKCADHDNLIEQSRGALTL